MRRTRLVAGAQLFLMLVAGAGYADAQSANPVIQSKVFQDEDGPHRYALFLPRDYSPDRQWPVILYLHGAGERGRDGIAQTKVGIGPVLVKRADSFPFIVVMPQCEDTRSRYLGGWLRETKDAQRALRILAAVEQEYAVDPDRRILTGWSMGGFGVWSLAADAASHWSAVVPLSGGGDEAWAEALVDVPIWAFHGSADAAIRPEQSRRMIAAIRSAGGTPRYTEVTDGEHDICPIVYDHDGLIRWMLEPQTTEPTGMVLRAPRTERRDEPFIPGIELSRAVTVRLGNDMLEALSMSLHEAIPRDVLSGAINDMYDSTTVEGRQFSIAFGSITYATSVHRVRVKAYREGRVNIQVGLKDAILRIGGTSVTGRDHSAYTGPIDIVIGNRAPVWLSADVTPYIENRRIRLKPAGASFQIPDDNWYVTAPAGVSVSGFGMTREKVSNGLVSGLYGSKYRIEQEVTAVVPKLIRAIESTLSLAETDEIVNSFWPLPVYRPRMRLVPEDVMVDPRGISLVLGAVAAAVDPKSAPNPAPRIDMTGARASSIDQSSDLTVSVAPKMLEPLTKMLIDANISRIHVLDIPESTFARFVDPEVMVEIFPELKRHGDDLRLWAELVLGAPIQIQAGKDAEEMVFQIPDLRIEMAYKPTKADDDWKRFADIQINVRQGAVPILATQVPNIRLFELLWSDSLEMDVTARFDPEYDAESKEVDEEALRELVQTAWERWTRQGPAARTPVPDIEFGIAKLHLSEVRWSDPFLGVSFGPPGVKITNSSDVPLKYETKGPFSGWGGPYTLPPGKTHDYPLAYPLIYRQQAEGKSFVYTLAPGSHSEYRPTTSGSQPQLFQAREDLRVDVE